MNGIERLADFFLTPPVDAHATSELHTAPDRSPSVLEPAGRAAARRPGAGADERAAPATIAILCAPGDADVAGGAFGTALAARGRGGCALVCRWPGRDRAPAPSPVVPAARRLAEQLAGRGLAARAAGRLCTVDLDADPVQAIASANRAAAAAGDVPVLLVIAGARDDPFDVVLGDHDRVVVATRPGTHPAIARLAVEDAARAARATGSCELAAAPPARALAAAGIALSPALRAAVRRALGES